MSIKVQRKVVVELCNYKLSPRYFRRKYGHYHMKFNHGTFVIRITTSDDQIYMVAWKGLSDICTLIINADLSTSLSTRNGDTVYKKEDSPANNKLLHLSKSIDLFLSMRKRTKIPNLPLIYKKHYCIDFAFWIGAFCQMLNGREIKRESSFFECNQLSSSAKNSTLNMSSVNANNNGGQIVFYLTVNSQYTIDLIIRPQSIIIVCNLRNQNNPSLTSGMRTKTMKDQSEALNWFTYLIPGNAPLTRQLQSLNTFINSN